MKKIKLPRKRKKIFLKEMGWKTYYMVRLLEEILVEQGEYETKVKQRKYRNPFCKMKVLNTQQIVPVKFY